jgi:DNA-binding response OmpR family regulator
MSAKRILLVDDDDAIRQVAAMSLQVYGPYEVLAADSGAAALAQAEAFAPDLVVLDASMPGMEGPEVLKALRGLPALRGTPVIFLTGRTQARDVGLFRSLGAADVVAKPFDPQHLAQRVAAALGAGGAATAPRQRTALVVEDDPGIAYLIGFMLEQEGWRMVPAADGHQALQAIESGQVTDVVLLDVMLPGVDGLALLQRLRALPQWDGVPVMMLSARGDEATVQKALGLGANDYLGKPFDPPEFSARLQRLVTSSPSRGS